MLFAGVLGNKSKTHRGTDDEVKEWNAIIREPFEKEVHLDHPLAGTTILLGHHGADEAVARDLLIESLGKEVLFGTVHPVLAVEFLRYGVAIIQNLPLLVRQVKIHH